MRVQSTEERFWARVDKSGECWLWIARLDRDGYGRLPWRGPIYLAHRYAWELLRGPIPEGLSIDHLCRVRHCVNPDHMEPVTWKTNTMRGDSFSAKNAAKTVCKWGHPFDKHNTYVSERGGHVGRHCRTCNRALVAAYQSRRHDLPPTVAA